MRRVGQGTRLPGADLIDAEAGQARVLLVADFVVWREARAFLASRVLAVDAGFVRAEGGFTAVAGAADAHADWFGDAGKLEICGGFPFAWFEGEAVFGEEGARFLLLHCAVVGDHGGFDVGEIGFWFGRGCGWALRLKKE